MKKLIIDIKNQFKKSKVFNFNVVNRDNWIKKEAAKIPKGLKILDVGAGSSPYRNLFKHCEYITQDFCQLDPWFRFTSTTFPFLWRLYAFLV